MKIYLSKSNKASNEIYQAIKQDLIEKGHYIYIPVDPTDEEEVGNCDILLIVPPETNYFTTSIKVGKGQYNQACYALRKRIDTYVYIKQLSAFYKARSISFLDENWTDSYGLLRDITATDCIRSVGYSHITNPCSEIPSTDSYNITKENIAKIIPQKQNHLILAKKLGII